MIVFLALAMAAEPPVTPVSAALSAELERTSELSLPDAPPIYLARTHALVMEQTNILASFGSTVHRNDSPFNVAYIELRVGEPAFDNTGFGGWQTGFTSASLPLQPTEEAVRLELWRGMDRSYKEAVEQYARKSAQFTAPDDYPGDYTLVEPVIDDLGTRDAPDRDGLEALAQRLSATLAEPVDGTRLVRGEVHVGAEAGTLWTLDSSGTHLRRPVAETSVRAVLHAQAEDGMLLADHDYLTAQSANALGTVETLEMSLRVRARRLVKLAEAPAFEGEYVGPVLFEQSAAVDLFRFVLVPQLEGTPDEIPFDSFFGDIGIRSAGDARLGRRVLPVGWDVRDDPLADAAFPGSFAYDAEGTPSQAVDLVTDGIVRTALMSRVPRSDIPETNGHARGALGQRAQGRASIMEVTAPKSDSTRKVHKKAMALAKSYGHDHYIVVRRLQEPSARLRSEPYAYLTDDEAQALPMPLAIVKVFADGREETLRGAQFTSVQRYALRDIAAVGAPETAQYLASADGQPVDSSPTSGLPTRLTAPSVLIGELELVAAPGDSRSIPLLAPPEQ
ncbi:MAG: hypothetical protein KC912_05530 [Proteobacteria bacterium]|nr:hypothetical protein [Pseudomonadota bacterium]